MPFGIITETELANATFLSEALRNPVSCRITGNYYAVVYNDASNYGNLKTFSISDNGVTVSVADTWQFITTPAQLGNYIINIGNGHFLIAKMTSAANDYLTIFTISIDSSGIINESPISSRIVETASSVNVRPFLVQVPGTNYVMVGYHKVVGGFPFTETYEIKVYSIDTSGNISTVVDTLSHASAGTDYNVALTSSHLALVNPNNNMWVGIYSRHEAATAGKLFSFTCNPSTGDLSAVLDSETTTLTDSGAYMHHCYVGTCFANSNIIACVWDNNSYNGKIQTASVHVTTGAITLIDSDVIVNDSRALRAQMISNAGDLFVMYCTSAANNPATMATYTIDGSGNIATNDSWAWGNNRLGGNYYRGCLQHIDGLSGAIQALFHPDSTTTANYGTYTTLSVTGDLNSAPVLAAIGAKSVNEGVLLEFTVTATDVDGDTLTMTTDIEPYLSTFVDNGDGTGTFSWTPNSTQSGVYTIRFTASDGSATDYEDVAITVNNVETYRTLERHRADVAEELRSATFGSADGATLVEEFLTRFWDPGMVVIPEGTWTLNLYGKVSSTAGGQSQFRVIVYKRSAAAALTQLFTADSGNLGTSVGLITWDVSGAEYSIEIEERILVRVYAVTASVADVTVDLYIEGSTHQSHLRTPMTEGPSSPNLDEVCDVGAITNQIIEVGGLRSDGVINVNYNGPDGDTYIYFYDASSPTTAYLKWSNTATGGQNANEFVLSHNLNMGTGYFRFTSLGKFLVWAGVATGVSFVIDVDGSATDVSLKVGGNYYVNASDRLAGNSFVYFYNAADNGAYLKWDASGVQFVLSHKLSAPLETQGFIWFRPEAAVLGDGTTGSLAPALSVLTTTDADDPQMRQYILGFDATTDEHAFWQFPMPLDYVSGGTLRVYFYMASDQADNLKKVNFEASLLAITANADADETTSLDATNESGGFASGVYTLNYANPALNDRMYYLDIDMSAVLDSVAAADMCYLALRRDADDATNDTAAGDANVVAVAFLYVRKA